MDRDPVLLDIIVEHRIVPHWCFKNPEYGQPRQPYDNRFLGSHYYRIDNLDGSSIQQVFLGQDAFEKRSAALVALRRILSRERDNISHRILKIDLELTQLER